MHHIIRITLAAVATCFTHYSTAGSLASIGVIAATQALLNISTERLDKEIDKTVTRIEQSFEKGIKLTIPIPATPTKPWGPINNEGSVNRTDTVEVDVRQAMIELLKNMRTANNRIIRPAKDCGMVVLNTALAANLPATIAVGVATGSLVYALRSTGADEAGKKTMAKLLSNYPQLKGHNHEMYAGLEAIVIALVGASIAYLVNN